MPTYDYICASRHTFEEYRPYERGGDHPTMCPECGALVRQVRRVVPVFYRRFGWKPYSPETSARGETVKEEICVSD